MSSIDWKIGDTARLGSTTGEVVRLNSLTLTIRFDHLPDAVVTASRRKFTKP